MKKETLKEILNRLDAVEKHLNINQNPTHEVGNWYGTENGIGCIYITIIKDYKYFNGYGVNMNGDWITEEIPGFIPFRAFPIKLTLEEAYERLKKWFIQNGYKEGVKVKCLNDSLIYEIREFEKYLVKYLKRDNEFWVRGLDGWGVCLMKNGKLAEIVEDNNIEVGDYVKVVDDDLIVFGIVLHTDYDHEYQKVSLKGCGWLPGKPTKITKEKYEQVKNM